MEEEKRGYTPKISLNELYNINELIGVEREEEPKTNFILASLFSLSNYLFKKNLRSKTNDKDVNEVSFDEYLTRVEEEITIYDRSKKSRSQTESKEEIEIFEVTTETPSIFEAELVRCYQKVPYVYFETVFFLNFSHLDCKLEEDSSRRKINKEQELLNENLDLVEINLFTQIHRKFHEYFKVVSNFDYLRDSISQQILKLNEARESVKFVYRDYILKSVRLRAKIIERQNIEKVQKILKTMKSLKKLPKVVESILQSSLPYDCLKIIEASKSSLESVHNLISMKNVTEIMRQCETIVQVDLNKRYINELYLYLEECLLEKNLNLNELWRGIDCQSVLDRDNSMFDNSRVNASNLTEKSIINVYDEVDIIDNKVENAKTNTYKRDEGKEYEIAMILLQSYHYIELAVDVNKIKVCNSLRVYVKKFEKELAVRLKKILKKELLEKQNIKNISILEQLNKEEEQENNKVQFNQFEEEEDEKGLVSQLVEKISVDCYIKHVSVLNDIFKEIINRFLGYIYTLLTEYQEELTKSLLKINKLNSEILNNNEENNFLKESFIKDQQHKQESQRRVLKEKHEKFKHILVEELELLPGIFRIIEEKIKYLLTLKNISGINSLQFYRWMSTLKYWDKYFEYLLNGHPVSQIKATSEDNLCCELLDELIEVYKQNVRKSMGVVGVNDLLLELTTNYIDTYHKNRKLKDLEDILASESWQSLEDVPSEFSEILFCIIYPQKHLNNTLSILNSSGSSRRSEEQNTSKESKGKLDKSNSYRLNYSKDMEWDKKSKFNILKNHIEVTTDKARKRYKVTISFLLLCEAIDEYLRMAKLFANLLPKQNESEKNGKRIDIKEENKIIKEENSKCNAITEYIQTKLFELIEKYYTQSKELILEAKALKQEQFKSKTINARHLCLLSHCFSLLNEIIECMEDEKTNEKINEHKSFIKNLTESNNNMIISKLSLMIQVKVESLISMCLTQDKPNAYSQFNKSIVEVFLGMIQVIIDYFDNEIVKKIIRPAFQSLIQKYITVMLLKGEHVRQELVNLHKKLEEFLRGYFPSEFDNLGKEIEG